MRRRYFILDVFTGTALAGNPLAVVLDSEGLDDAAMQAIAGEFNLSETVFVRPPADPRHRASLRIFTPGRELPFAGHPTVGAASLLGLLDGGDDVAFGLEEKVGIVPCVVEKRGEGAAYARFRCPRLPELAGDPPSIALAAQGLGLQPRDIAGEPEMWSAGVPFPIVPVQTLEALGRATLTGTDVTAGTGHIYLFVQTDSQTFRVRMFAPGMGITEDPATGAAAAAFSGYLFAHHKPSNGDHDFLIEQGIEMGRPSRIELQLIVAEGALSGVEIGGEALIVAEGALRL